jgi:hypothetical protein
MKLVQKLKDWLDRPGVLIILPVIALLLTLPSLFIGFTTDDHYFKMLFQDCPGLPELDQSKFSTFQFFEDDPKLRQMRLERGLLPWWANEHGRLSFMRPLTSLTHWIDWQLFGNKAWLMHLNSVLMYAAVVLAVTLLYRRLHQPLWVAGLAALFYAVDDAHGMPVGWISNRNALLTTLFSVLVLIFHDRWRRDHWKPGPFLACISLGLGLLSGEAGVAVGGYLFAYALLLDKSSLIRRFLALAPYGVIVVIWRVAYRAYGFGAYGSATYVDPVSETGLFLSNTLKHIPILLGGQFALPDSSLWIFAPPLIALIWLILAIAIMLLIAVLLLPSIRHHRLARFWLLGMLLSLLPSCATVPQDRLLIMSGLGGMGLLAIFFQDMLEKPAWLPQSGPWFRIARIAAPLWVIIHLLLSPLLLTANAVMPGQLEKSARRAVDSLPSHPEIAEETLIIVHNLSDVMAVGIPIYRSSLQQPVPKHTWLLSAGNQGVEVSRPDSQTLIVVPDGGFLTKPWAQIYQSPEKFPMKVGEQTVLSGMVAEIMEMDKGGRPAVVKYTFTKILEDPTLHWVVWNDIDYVPFLLPQVGETTTIEKTSVRGLLKKNYNAAFSE